MIAQIKEQLHTRSQYVKCLNCGMHQMRDFNNDCMYCGSKQFVRVYEEYDEESYHEMW
jgi:DNA-directed RNA polymerase subunit RPC12/RpoP